MKYMYLSIGLFQTTFYLSIFVICVCKLYIVFFQIFQPFFLIIPCVHSRIFPDCVKALKTTYYIRNIPEMIDPINLPNDYGDCFCCRFQL